jgi:GNAT superfamily N-acetyltransferase
MNISLRQAKPEDLDWLDVFYESLMRPYVELTHDWDEKRFREIYNTETISTIQLDCEDIGMLKTEKRKDHICRGDIQLKEAFQRRGIGTSLIRDVMEKSKAEGLPLRLRVLKENPVMKLYNRLGFVKTNEFKHCHELEWRAKTVRAAGVTKPHR